MSPIQSLTASVSARLSVVTHVVTHGVLARLEHRAGDRERGDVPGWVLITLMTAGLVTVLWALADTQLKLLFTKAMNSVTGP